MQSELFTVFCFFLASLVTATFAQRLLSFVVFYRYVCTGPDKMIMNATCIHWQFNDPALRKHFWLSTLLNPLKWAVAVPDYLFACLDMKFSEFFVTEDEIVHRFLDTSDWLNLPGAWKTKRIRMKQLCVVKLNKQGGLFSACGIAALEVDTLTTDLDMRIVGLTNPLQVVEHLNLAAARQASITTKTVMGKREKKG